VRVNPIQELIKYRWHRSSAICLERVTACSPTQTDSRQPTLGSCREKVDRQWQYFCKQRQTLYMCPPLRGNNASRTCIKGSRDSFIFTSCLLRSHRLVPRPPFPCEPLGVPPNAPTSSSHKTMGEGSTAHERALNNDWRCQQAQNSNPPGVPSLSSVSCYSRRRQAHNQECRYLLKIFSEEPLGTQRHILAAAPAAAKRITHASTTPLRAGRHGSGGYECAWRNWKGAAAEPVPARKKYAPDCGIKISLQ